MTEPRDGQDAMRRFAQEDMLGTGLRVLLSFMGPVGVIAGEFVTQFVPQQRVDRLQAFVERLHDRLSEVEEKQFKARLQEPAYSALAEQTFIAAVQTSSDQRRRDLAALLTNGMSRVEAELEQQHLFLRLLEQLRDPEVLVLAYYRVVYLATHNNSAPADFRRKHAPVLDVMPPTGGSSDEERRGWMMYEHYQDRLLSLGLVKATEGTARSSMRQLEITRMGSLLLDAIDRVPENAQN